MTPNNLQPSIAEQAGRRAPALIAGIAALSLIFVWAPAEARRPGPTTRDASIHWPKGFDPARADLFAHNSGDIHAPCTTVWKHLVAVREWPEWYANSKNVTLPDREATLEADTHWRWTTFGLAIESHVQEYVAGRRLGWFGGAPGEAPAFYHSWHLVPLKGGCRVITEEVGNGAGAIAFRNADPQRMSRGHTLWLAALKWISEGR